jgi:hypothetical protein
VFQSTRLKLAAMFSEECRGGSNRNSHSGIGSDSRVGTWGTWGTWGQTPRPGKQDVGSDPMSSRAPDAAFGKSGPIAR